MLRVVGNGHVLEEEGKKDFDKLYQVFFAIDRDSFLETGKRGFTEVLNNLVEDFQARREKLVALCELIVAEMKL
ncbi:hypothetical protein MM239_20120 [Belliella sp. DSM 111904]|uniref:Uncharacterized protein n=1 Tax=Belliella filtrata TaxID=2923435 RepID=A0ABS9V5L0_9BACT|nr:hypothetical protein [Belliella filtrata]MCH7411704.1 hypothetical protein [Belliella filtrata]